MVLCSESLHPMSNTFAAQKEKARACVYLEKRYTQACNDTLHAWKISKTAQPDLHAFSSAVDRKPLAGGNCLLWPQRILSSQTISGSDRMAVSRHAYHHDARHQGKRIGKPLKCSQNRVARGRRNVGRSRCTCQLLMTSYLCP